MTKHKANETFSDFFLRWRKKAMKMTNCPTEKDQVRLVVKNLLPIYYEKLYYLPISTFEQLYDMGIQLEDGRTARLNAYQPKRFKYQPASKQASEEVVAVQAIEGGIEGPFLSLKSPFLRCLRS